MTKRPGDSRLPYRHFERSEKSLSFAAQWSMGGNPKWETCHQETFGHRRLQKRCLGTLINRLLETHFSTLFHTVSALSAPSGHLPLEGKAKYTRGASLFLCAAPQPLEPLEPIEPFEFFESIEPIQPQTCNPIYFRSIK